MIHFKLLTESNSLFSQVLIESNNPKFSHLFPFPSDTQSGVPGWGIALIVITIIVIVLVFLALGMVTAHVLISRRQSKLIISKTAMTLLDI